MESMGPPNGWLIWGMGFLSQMIWDENMGDGGLLVNFLLKLVRGVWTAADFMVAVVC